MIRRGNPTGNLDSGLADIEHHNVARCEVCRSIMVANAAGPSLDRYNAEAILVRPAHMMTDEMDAVTGCFRRDSSDRVAISNDPTVFKPDHAIGKTQDFGYVMAHEKGRSAEFVMQTFELILQLSPHCR
ncbi:MAG: hypothetical protein J0H60_18035, partial [Rhizobiales bacterium]|nr:hypothetical protein [Hyphomicrobiales bacterium]